MSENIAIQLAESREYAHQEGWKIVAEFSDDDISASKYSTKERPGYRALLDAIRAGEVDVVLVTEMPRLYRRLEELLELIYLAETTPLRGIETTDGAGYDLSTGQGIHNAVSAVNNAMLESRKLSDRLKRKNAARAREGAYHGGSRPYGYERDGVTVRESEANVIRTMVAKILAGTPIIVVVRWLNDSGIPTVEGKRWRTSTVRRLLSRKRLMGVRVHNGVEYPAVWPAILSADEFDRVNLILKAEARGRNGGNVYGRTYLLTGMIFCGVCGEPAPEGRPVNPGAPLVGFAHRRHAGEPTVRRYFCKRYDDHGAQRGCGRISRMAEPVEALVADAVLEVLDSPRMAELLGAAAQDQEMAGLIEQYQAGKMKLDDLIADYASGLLNRQQLAQAKVIVEAAMETTSRRMEQLQSGQALASLPVGQSLREAWAGASMEWRRQLVALVVDKVILHPSSTHAPLWPNPDTDPELAEQLGQRWWFDPAMVEIRWKV